MKPDLPHRPSWALPVLVLGLLAAAGSLVVDAWYIATHLAQHGRYDSFLLLFNVLLVPLGVVLLLTGGLRVDPAARARETSAASGGVHWRACLGGGGVR